MIAWDFDLDRRGYDTAGPTTGATVTYYSSESDMPTIVVLQTCAREVRTISVDNMPCEYAPEPFERVQRLRADRAMLFGLRGAVLGGDGVRYWPVTKGQRGGCQRLDRRPQVRRSGVMDWTRGRHWDRRSRYGER